MSPQQTIAHYRITAKLGQGGMGEVYRATDTKLGREVAIKILPDAFAQDAGRMARFAREAQVLASLNHPNIAAIYGVEERALVMELVEGPTLADRLFHIRGAARFKAAASAWACPNILSISWSVKSAPMPLTQYAYTTMPASVNFLRISSKWLMGVSRRHSRSSSRAFKASGVGVLLLSLLLIPVFGVAGDPLAAAACRAALALACSI